MSVADHAPRSGNDRHAGWGRRALLLAGPAVLAIGSVGWYLAGGRYVETDNAYLRADFVVVSPRIDGVVASVNVQSDQSVRAGDVLFALDLGFQRADRVDGHRVEVDRDVEANLIARGDDQQVGQRGEVHRHGRQHRSGSREAEFG